MAKNYTLEDHKKLVDKFFKSGLSKNEFERKYGVCHKTINRALKAVEAENDKPIAGGYITPPQSKREVLKGDRFVFTSSQNNTYIHKEFLKNLEKYCKHNKAQLIVGRFRYNKSGFQNLSDDDNLWYDPSIVKYIKDTSCIIGEGKQEFVWCGELDILPTAVNPMSGLDSYTGSASAIIPHAKVQMQSMPVLRGEDVRQMFTTGTITKRNYIQKKAGQKAEFHHVFGAIVVEIDKDGDYFARQLIADSSGSFYDLDKLYKNGKVTAKQSIEAIHWGDMHAEMLDDEVANTSWLGKNNMLDTLKPRYQFVHDLTDFKARNHHNLNNPHFLADRYFNCDDLVNEGMEKSANLLKDLQRSFSKVIVVESNHDQAFKRWLAEADIKKDPANAEYYHKSNAEIFKQIRLGNTGFHIFEWAVRQHADLPFTKFLSEDESFTICGKNGIECGMHGHRGINGARGNAKSLTKMGKKCNIGHTHSPSIVDGVYVAGISCKMDMGYNKGPSSWAHSHIITYKNGKRAIVTVKNGKYRA